MANLKRIIFVLYSILFYTSGFTQQNQVFQGYSAAVSGMNFNYHSPVRDYSPSLLIRAQADYEPIVWSTEAVPPDFKGDTAVFVWAYGIDVTPHPKNFSFFINGKKFFSFSNPVTNQIRKYSYKGPDGSLLVFNVTKIDKYKDQMGFASLYVPAKYIKPGSPVTISVHGEKAKSNVWYMIFKEKLTENCTVFQKDLVQRKNGKLFYVVGVDYTRVGKEVSAEIQAGSVTEKVRIVPGLNTFEILLPADLKNRSIEVKIVFPGKSVISKNINLHDVKEWTVYLVQHTHTDIGYTRPQTEILAEHLRYIDTALDLCDLTDSYPDNAKFRWTCEVSWPVREYLKCRPKEQIKRLVKRVKEGRIEVTGMLINYSELVDETGLAAQLACLRDFKNAGITVKTLMQDDVNGMGWSVTDYAENTDIKYVLMGEHGHRARLPFDKPTPFWWESRSGAKLLAYRSEHYMHGNVLGLTSGDLRTFQRKLSLYLQSLEAKKYPYSRIAFQFSGYVTDNSPPSTVACDIVKEWNKKYKWPELRLATAQEFFRFIEKNHKNDLPVIKGAWPDWWSDGYGSALRETQAARAARKDLIVSESVLSMAGFLGVKFRENIFSDIDLIEDNLLFYDEHTFGAAESISDPLCTNSMVQWYEKASYPWQAVMQTALLREKATGAVQQFLHREQKPLITVFNTLNWARSGIVEIYIDHQILPENRAFRIVDFEGNVTEMQEIRSRNDGTYWALWAEHVPPVGFKQYRIELLDTRSKTDENRTFLSEISNKFYKVTIDTLKGEIAGIFDKELGKVITDSLSPEKFGTFIYERLENRHQLERFTSSKRDTVYVPLKGSRKKLQNVKVVSAGKGHIWNSVVLKGMMPGCADSNGVDIEIRLYNKTKLIEFYYNMVKIPVREAEAVYVAFPFNVPDFTTHFDVQGGEVRPGIDQIKGTSADWNLFQNYVSIKNKNMQIVWTSPGIPLVQLGSINTGRFYYSRIPEKPYIFSWVLNNFWTTNFKAFQQGQMSWSYYFTSTDDTSSGFAGRFGYGLRTGFASRVLLPGNNKGLHEKSFLNLDKKNIILVQTKPSKYGNGIVLQLRETEGRKTLIRPDEALENFKSVSIVNVFGEKIKDIHGNFYIKPYENIFIKIEL